MDKKDLKHKALAPLLAAATLLPMGPEDSIEGARSHAAATKRGEIAKLTEGYLKQLEDIKAKSLAAVADGTVVKSPASPDTNAEYFALLDSAEADIKKGNLGPAFARLISAKLNRPMGKEEEGKVAADPLLAPLKKLEDEIYPQVKVTGPLIAR